MIANRDHGQQALILEAGANYREVAGAAIDYQQEVLGGIEANGTRGLPGRDEEFLAVDGANDATVVDVHSGDAISGGVAHIEQARVGIEDSASGRVAQHNVVADFVGPGIDRLQTVRVGRDDVELAAVRLEQHVRRNSGELQICQQDTAAQIDDRQTGLNAAQDESDGAIGENGDVGGLRNNWDRDALNEGGGVVNRQRGISVIEDENGFAIGGDAGEHRFATGRGPAQYGV